MVMNVFKKKPIRIISGSSLFVYLYFILINIINRVGMIYYILSGIMVSLILIYSIYAKVNFDYEKVNTNFKLLKFRFDIVNGYLITRFLIYIVTCTSLFLININPFQKQRFDLISIAFIIVIAICLLMFVKICPASPKKNDPEC